MKLYWMIGALAASTLMGCGPSEPAQEPDDGDNGKQMCEATMAFARKCYDVSDPKVDCGLLRTEVARKLEELSAERGWSMTEGQVDGLAKVCTAACDARKNDVPWSQVNDSVDCSKY